MPLDAVERRLEEHPGIHEACVAALPDTIWGNRIAALVQTNAAVDRCAWIRDRFPPVWWPRRIVCVRTLPRTPLGKVDRNAARHLASRGD